MDNGLCFGANLGVVDGPLPCCTNLSGRFFFHQPKKTTWQPWPRGTKILGMDMTDFGRFRRAKSERCTEGQERPGSLGVYSTTSVTLWGISLCILGLFVFGRPFLLNHRSGFHFPQPWERLMNLISRRTSKRCPEHSVTFDRRKGGLLRSGHP